MSFNIDDDYRVADRTQTVTYHARLDDSTFAADETVTEVMARPQTAASANVTSGRTLGGQGALARSETVFHIWAARLTAVPKVRDELTDAQGVRWVVMEVDTQSLASRYRIHGARKR